MRGERLKIKVSGDQVHFVTGEKKRVLVLVGHDSSVTDFVKFKHKKIATKLSEI